MMRRFAVLTVLMVMGCDSGTGGELVSTRFEVEVAALDDAGLTLEEGTIAVGPLYANERAAPTTQVFRRLANWVWPSAWAHDGHDFFSGGQVVSEWLRPTAIVLRPGRYPLGETRSIAGPVRSATLHLLPLEALKGATLTLRGQRNDNDQGARPWSLTLTLPGSFDDRRVDFISADGTLAEGSTLVLELQPAAWFIGARFEEDQLDPLDPASQTARAVAVNLKRASSWRLRVE